MFFLVCCDSLVLNEKFFTLFSNNRKINFNLKLRAHETSSLIFKNRKIFIEYPLCDYSIKMIILQGDERDLKSYETRTYRLVGRTYRPRKEAQSGLCQLSSKCGWRGWCSHKGDCPLPGVAGWGNGWQGPNDKTHSPQVRKQSLTASTDKIRKNIFFLSNYELLWSGFA